MQLYPNQKQVIITKENTNHYCQIDRIALNGAMQKLNGGAFKLWVYLVKNKSGTKISLSPSDCSKWGIKRDSYHRGIKELIDKGFLVQSEKFDSVYYFIEAPW